MLQDNLEDHYDIDFKSERMLPSWKGDASKTIDILNMNLIKNKHRYKHFKSFWSFQYSNMVCVKL